MTREGKHRNKKGNEGGERQEMIREGRKRKGGEITGSKDKPGKHIERQEGKQASSQDSRLCTLSSSAVKETGSRETGSRETGNRETGSHLNDSATSCSLRPSLIFLSICEFEIISK